MKVIGDADHNTAQIALQISELLLSHRKIALLEFEEECISASRQQSQL